MKITTYQEQPIGSQTLRFRYYPEREQAELHLDNQEIYRGELDSLDEGMVFKAADDSKIEVILVKRLGRGGLNFYRNGEVLPNSFYPKYKLNPMPRRSQISYGTVLLIGLASVLLAIGNFFYLLSKLKFGDPRPEDWVQQVVQTVSGIGVLILAVVGWRKRSWEILIWVALLFGLDSLWLIVAEANVTNQINGPLVILRLLLVGRILWGIGPLYEASQKDEITEPPVINQLQE